MPGLWGLPLSAISRMDSSGGIFVFYYPVCRSLAFLVQLAVLADAGVSRPPGRAGDSPRQLRVPLPHLVVARLGIVGVVPQVAPFDFQQAAFEADRVQDGGLLGVVGQRSPRRRPGR